MNFQQRSGTYLQLAHVGVCMTSCTSYPWLPSLTSFYFVLIHLPNSSLPIRDVIWSPGPTQMPFSAEIQAAVLFWCAKLSRDAERKRWLPPASAEIRGRHPVAGSPRELLQGEASFTARSSHSTGLQSSPLLPPRPWHHRQQEEQCPTATGSTDMALPWFY